MHSIKNKDLLLSEQLNNLNIDSSVVTETWLKDTLEDKAWLNQSELMQNSFTVRTHNRPGQKKGGGIALIHKKSLMYTAQAGKNTNYRVCSMENHSK